METRKRRATELIEKCDLKLSPFIERTSIVHIYDRKVKIELGEHVLANTSLYSLLRAWVQDDPDKSFVDDMRVRKIRNMPAESYWSENKATNAHGPLIKLNVSVA
jgi:UDP-2,3-diacylglucosamine pyrophosphatase LpxH